VADFNQFGSAKPGNLGGPGNSQHCSQSEAMLSDALDGTLSATDQATFDLHLVGCPSCAAMLADARILAGIDMDGATVALIPERGLSRPFLFLGKQENYTPGSGIIGSPDGKHVKGSVITWERDWRLLTGWKRWLVVAGAKHASFTDLGLLADQAGIDIGAGLRGERGLEVTRGYVRAFFDEHLRGTPQARLDRASPQFPEVMFCSP